MHHHHLHFESLPSTHLYAIEKGKELEDGTVITANFQTQGKGRYDRTWVSGPGDSLLLSFILKPDVQTDTLTLITPLMSLAAIQLLDAYALKAFIRWPNDVLVNDQKIAGILAEASFEGSKLSHLTASIGINLNQQREALDAIDRPATSLFAETHERLEPADALSRFLAAFDAFYATYLTEGFSALAETWRKLQALTGKRVVVDLGTETAEGLVTAFTDDGCMELQDAQGKTLRLNAGEVIQVQDA